MSKRLISIVVPCYNEEKAIPFFVEEIRKTADGMKAKYDTDFEYIFVDDGSKDDTANVIKNFAVEFSDIKYVIFSRNFGKEAALYAGLKKSKGDFVAVMDADLQDPPSMLPEMFDAVSSGEFDAAAARRVDRKGEPVIRSFFARRFYKLINRISQTEIVDGARDYRLMSRRMVDAVLELTEYNRFSKGIFSWVGFKTKWLEYKNTERVAGETKWSFYKLLIYSLEGIAAFSVVPLAISVVIGLLLLVVAVVLAVVGAVTLITNGHFMGDHGFLTFLTVLLSGIVLLCTGINGQYLAKTYMEVKKRPVYIAKEESREVE